MMYNDFPAHIILRELESDNLLPAILFRTARKQCDVDVESLARNDQTVLNQEQRLRIET
jgi:superfamily II RNA helicase